LLKDGQRRRERPDWPEWRRAILQQVQDERNEYPRPDAYRRVRRTFFSQVAVYSRIRNARQR